MHKPAEFDADVATINRAMGVDGLRHGGLDLSEFPVFIEDRAVEEALRAKSASGGERSIFGAPAICVGDEMHIGQGHLDFIVKAMR